MSQQWRPRKLPPRWSLRATLRRYPESKGSIRSAVTRTTRHVTAETGMNHHPFVKNRQGHSPKKALREPTQYGHQTAQIHPPTEKEEQTRAPSTVSGTTHMGKVTAVLSSRSFRVSRHPFRLRPRSGPPPPSLGPAHPLGRKIIPLHFGEEIRAPPLPRKRGTVSFQEVPHFRVRGSRRGDDVIATPSNYGCTLHFRVRGSFDHASRSPAPSRGSSGCRRSHNCAFLCGIY